MDKSQVRIVANVYKQRSKQMVDIESLIQSIIVIKAGMRD